MNHPDNLDFFGGFITIGWKSLFDIAAILLAVAALCLALK